MAVPPPTAAPAPATTAVPTAIPPPPAATAPPPRAAKDAFVSAAPERELIAVPVLAAPNRPADPAIAASAGAATNAAPPVTTVAATVAATGLSFTESSTAWAASPTCSTTTSPTETARFSAESRPRPILSKTSQTLMAMLHYRDDSKMPSSETFDKGAMSEGSLIMSQPSSPTSRTATFLAPLPADLPAAHPSPGKRHRRCR
ncbi:hypothetical protein PszF2a_13790 [Stutzerimonas stutzeri]|nr:hypothetical protein PszF2a_13790 [Stutzerimonas stutzeri]